MGEGCGSRHGAGVGGLREGAGEGAGEGGGEGGGEGAGGCSLCFHIRVFINIYIRYITAAPA